MLGKSVGERVPSGPAVSWRSSPRPVRREHQRVLRRAPGQPPSSPARLSNGHRLAGRRSDEVLPLGRPPRTCQWHLALRGTAPVTWSPVSTPRCARLVGHRARLLSSRAVPLRRSRTRGRRPSGQLRAGPCSRWSSGCRRPRRRRNASGTTVGHLRLIAEGAAATSVEKPEKPSVFTRVVGAEASSPVLRPTDAVRRTERGGEPHEREADHQRRCGDGGAARIPHRVGVRQRAGGPRRAERRPDRAYRRAPTPGGHDDTDEHHERARARPNWTWVEQAGDVAGTGEAEDDASATPATSTS